MSIFTVYSAFVYYLTLLLFGAAGLTLHFFCLLCGWLPATPRVERFFQRLIARHFAAFLAWLAFTRVVRVEYRGFKPCAAGGLVMVANHPGLMDATYLLARLPAAVCIFKGSLRRNPVLGAARRAGYLANDGGLALVRAASAKVAAGATLVIFPEGTRTPVGRPLGAFQSGFAAIARRARVPIQLVRISSETRLLAKGRAWWKIPQLPAHVVVQAGPLLDIRTAGSTLAVVRQVEAWFRAPLHSPRDALFRPQRVDDFPASFETVESLASNMPRAGATPGVAQEFRLTLPRGADT